MSFRIFEFWWCNTLNRLNIYSIFSISLHPFLRLTLLSFHLSFPTHTFIPLFSPRRLNATTRSTEIEQTPIPSFPSFNCLSIPPFLHTSISLFQYFLFFVDWTLQDLAEIQRTLLSTGIHFSPYFLYLKFLVVFQSSFRSHIHSFIPLFFPRRLSITTLHIHYLPLFPPLKPF